MIQDNDTIADRRNKIANRVLDALDRWSERLDGRSSQKRQYPRKPFRSTITIHLPEEENAAGEVGNSDSFQAWSRNLSCGGLSFIFHRQIKREKFVICLSNGKGPLWFNAEVTRARQVHEGFWEYGVAFKGRAQMEQ
jgi:hypothetical protein